MKKKIALVLAIIVALGAILAFAGCNKQDGTDKDTKNSDLAYVQDNGKLVIGITEYEPMNYKENGEWTGFDTEFAQAVCAELGVKAEFFVLADWETKFLELNSKSDDCIWNGMTITDEALKNASVSDPYVKNAQVIVANKDTAAKYSSLEEMKDLKFAVEGESAGHKEIKGKVADENIAVLANQSDALLEVASGSADACVIDITMANNMTGEGTSYATLTQVCSLNEEEYGIAFRKDSDITAKVNEIMAEMKANGKLDALAEKYDLTLVK